MLSHLLDENDPDLPMAMEHLAGHLVTLLRQAPPCPHEETAETVHEKLAGNLRQTVAAIGLTLSAVITSYSIHYTKLYEYRSRPDHRFQSWSCAESVR